MQLGQRALVFGGLAVAGALAVGAGGGLVPELGPKPETTVLLVETWMGETLGKSGADERDSGAVVPVLCAKRGKDGKSRLLHGSACVGKVPARTTLRLMDGRTVETKGKRRMYLCPDGEAPGAGRPEDRVTALWLPAPPSARVAVWPASAPVSVTLPDFSPRVLAADEERAIRAALAGALSRWTTPIVLRVHARLSVDLDATGSPEALFSVSVHFPGDTGARASLWNYAVALGTPAPVRFSVSGDDRDHGPITPLAATDLDGDGRPEVILQSTELVTVHGPDGKRLFEGFGCIFL